MSSGLVNKNILNTITQTKKIYCINEETSIDNRYLEAHTILVRKGILHNFSLKKVTEDM